MPSPTQKFCSVAGQEETRCVNTSINLRKRFAKLSCQGTVTLTTKTPFRSGAGASAPRRAPGQARIPPCSGTPETCPVKSGLGLLVFGKPSPAGQEKWPPMLASPDTSVAALLQEASSQLALSTKVEVFPPRWLLRLRLQTGTGDGPKRACVWAPRLLG